MAEKTDKLTYPVLDRLDYDKTYLAGDTVEMPPADAEPLIRLRVLGEAQAPAKPEKRPA